MANKNYMAEIGVEQEATPGTAETIVEADLLVRPKGSYSHSLDVDLIETEEIQAVGSMQEDVPGRKSFSASMSYLLRGPGDLTTAPIVADLFESAGLAGAAAKTIAVGAISGGPYKAGEIITGGTSSATGLVLRETAASPIPYLPVSGVLQSGETITGGDSAASSTSSGAPADGGYAWRPADWDMSSAGHHATVKVFRGGHFVTGRGCLSTLSAAIAASGVCEVKQNFSGAYEAHGDVALFGKEVFSEEAQAWPLAQSQNLKLGSYTPKGVANIVVNVNPAIELDGDVTKAGGVAYANYKCQKPTVTLSIDQVAVATYNALEKLRGGGSEMFEITLGDTSGNQFAFVIPNAQVIGSSPSEGSSGKATYDFELSGSGVRNEEILIYQF